MREKSQISTAQLHKLLKEWLKRNKKDSQS